MFAYSWSKYICLSAFQLYLYIESINEHDVYSFQISIDQCDKKKHYHKSMKTYFISDNVRVLLQGLVGSE